MNNKGFTLLEVVLVVAIIGILASLILPNFGKAQLSSRVITHNANVKMLKSAAGLYLLDNPDIANSDISKETLNYIDKNFDLKLDPVIGEQLASEHFKVELKNGFIVISPGEVELVNDNIQLKNELGDS